MTSLCDGTFARGGASAAVSDAAWFRALLDVDAALADHRRLTEGTS